MSLMLYTVLKKQLSQLHRQLFIALGNYLGIIEMNFYLNGHQDINPACLKSPGKYGFKNSEKFAYYSSSSCTL